MWGVYCKCKVGSRAESSLLQPLIYKSFQCIEIHQMSIQGQPMPFMYLDMVAYFLLVSKNNVRGHTLITLACFCLFLTNLAFSLHSV